MNSIVTRVSSPCAPVLAQRFSPETRRCLDQLLSGVATISEIGAVPVSVRDEAESILATVGPIRTIGLGAFTDWIEPFFIATGSRAVSKADQDKQIDAIWNLIADMPEEVFTLENQRALAKVCEFVTTAAKIHAVMGDQATRVVRTRMALRSLAELPPPALPAPAPPSDEERATGQAEVSRLVASFKASLVGRPVYGVRPGGLSASEEIERRRRWSGAIGKIP